MRICLLLLLPAAAMAQLPDWDFTQGDLGWRPNSSLGEFTFNEDGLNTSLDSTDPWLIGPPISVPAADARYVRVRLRVAHHGGGSVYFATDSEPDFKQANMLKFRVAPGGDWQDIWLDTASAPGWKGTLTKLRLDPIDVWPNIPAGQAIVISRVTMLPGNARPADVQLKLFHAGESWRVGLGDSIHVRAILTNRGGGAAELKRCELSVPDFLRVTQAAQPRERIAPDEEATFEWRLLARKHGAGVITMDAATNEGQRLLGARRIATDCPAIPDSARTLTLGDARLVAERTAAWGYGAFRLEARHGTGRWLTVARVPSLGTVLTVTPAGEFEALELVGCSAPEPITEGGHEGWRMACDTEDSTGRNWHAELQMIPDGANPPVFATSLRVRCDSEAVLRRLDGPTILMEPVPDAERRGGMFGGLEWLEGAEECWSEAVDRSPLRIRYRPHVNRIAVPAMSLATAHATVGWLWQPGDAPPGAVFGAPTREMTGRGDSVMGLFRPAIDTPAGENLDFGMAPTPLAAGEEITIAADLLLGPSEADASLACLHWVNRFGLPGPPATPRGIAQDELDFTMSAFIDSLWVEEEAGWQNGVGPSKNIGRFGPFLGAAVLGSRWLEGARAEACARRLRAAWGDPGGYRGNLLPWYEGSLIGTFGRRVGGHAQTAQLQNDDGGWDFEDWLTIRRKQGETRLYDLGAKDRSEVGFGAHAASTLLLLARITGDEVAREAGLKALAWLDTFTVPRAAQCWEVPAHAPDIVAAADAIRAFVDGYWLTGDEAHLRSATRWAVRGLPFIYTWGDPDLPGMLYGSIPVLGATWYDGSWYGRPVQWCGDAYAVALGMLIDAGVAEPWTRVRAGLLASSALQQFTEPHRRALIPDSIDLTLDGLPADYWVPPYYQAMALAHTLGAAPTPRTAVAGDCRISAMGELTAAWDGDTLSIIAQFPERRAHHILMAGCGEIGRVVLAGEEIPRVAEINELVGGDCWTIDAARGLAEIRVARAQRAAVVVEGLNPAKVKLLPR